MISEDYSHILKMSAMVEQQIVKECWKMVEKYNYPAEPISYRLVIIPGVATIDRYIETTYIGDKEALTLEISGRSIAVMETGYRE